MDTQIETDLKNAEATIAALRAEMVRIETQLKQALTPVWPDPWEDMPADPNPRPRLEPPSK